MRVEDKPSFSIHRAEKGEVYAVTIPAGHAAAREIVCNQLPRLDNGEVVPTDRSIVISPAPLGEKHLYTVSVLNQPENTTSEGREKLLDRMFKQATPRGSIQIQRVT